MYGMNRMSKASIMVLANYDIRIDGFVVDSSLEINA